MPFPVARTPRIRHYVIMPPWISGTPCAAAATGFADQLRAAGLDPVGADLPELLGGGGSVKCCTLEVHP